MSVANTVERQMLDLINQERSDVGLNPVKLNTLLNASSEDHTQWMLDSDQFSHRGLGGSSATERIAAADYPLEGSWATAENIAWQSERGAEGIADDVVQLHQGLMDSPGHRANILNPDFTEIGIGIERGDFNGFDGLVVTQNFARTDGDTSATVEPDVGVTPTQAPVPTPMPEPEITPEPTPQPVPESEVLPEPTPVPETVPEPDQPIAEAPTLPVWLTELFGEENGAETFEFTSTGNGADDSTFSPIWTNVAWAGVQWGEDVVQTRSQEDTAVSLEADISPDSIDMDQYVAKDWWMFDCA